MITINPVGIAASLTPGSKGTNGTYPTNIYLMPGTMPSADILNEIETEAAFNTAYPDKIFKFNSIGLATSFDKYTNYRSYKKTPVDALDFTPEMDGIIGWAAIVFSGERIMFVDSIGDWDDTEASISVSALDVTTTKDESFKDLHIAIRDKSTYELYPNGILGA